MSILKPEWLPAGVPVERVVLHWTAGGNKPNALDLAHYHFVVPTWLDGQVGEWRAEVRRAVPLTRYVWPAHVRGLNRGSVGISMCGMRGSVYYGHGKVNWGNAPIQRVQFERAAEAAAQVLKRYGLPVTERTCLVHSEVTSVYGIVQRGRWDVDALPWQKGELPPDVHARWRRAVQWYMDKD